MFGAIVVLCWAVYLCWRIGTRDENVKRRYWECSDEDEMMLMHSVRFPYPGPWEHRMADARQDLWARHMASLGVRY